MARHGLQENLFYMVTDGFWVQSFNQRMADIYPDLKVGACCYKAIMQRDEPCLHCPIAGNTEDGSPAYYDEHFECWMQAIFTYLGGDDYAVACSVAMEQGEVEEDEDLSQEQQNEIVMLYNTVQNKLTEIMDLNDELRDFSEEQEDQLSKITALNKELQQAVEEAETANKAKSIFLFNMSHDIRTPLNAITGFAELLEKDHVDPDRCAHYVDRIKEAGRMLFDLINGVLEMAKIESGKTELDEIICKVDEIDQDLPGIFEEILRQKRIKLEGSVQVKHQYIYCDPVKLRQIFLNILSNAVKFTPAGGRITMDLRELPTDKEGYVRFQSRIVDNGVGMSEEYLPHLFEAFSREHTVTENKLEGAGLGMSIVKQLVDLMEGSIEVTSQPGRGTTVVTTLYHRIAVPQQAEKAAAVDPMALDFSGKRVLLTEDNDINAEIATFVLENAGFQVERAEDGLVCINMLQMAPADHYDLILMDIQMPNMDGYTAARTIRNLADPARRQIPIIALTANAFAEDRQNAFAAGMDEHLSKPINPKIMLGTLARFCL